MRLRVRSRIVPLDFLEQLGASAAHIAGADSEDPLVSPFHERLPAKGTPRWFGASGNLATGDTASSS